jgi:uncharacterized protein (TIGR02678 family)
MSNRQLDDADEQRRALRVLLMRPLVTSDGEQAADFALVRRYAPTLREWLSRNAGWTLEVHADAARLRKTPGDLHDPTRGVVDEQTGVPFSRRRYVLFCLALAELERCERQITLKGLADGIQNLVAADPALASAGIKFDLQTQDQRADIVKAVRLLLSLRVLTRIHGDENQYLAERGDALYNVNRAALTFVLNVRRSPSSISSADFETRLDALVEEIVPDSEEGRNRRIRSGLVRRLLDDPVLAYDSLDLDERSYLDRQRPFITREIGEATGLVAEVRQEGIAMVDDSSDLTDIAIPEEGTDGHVTLLLAEFLASKLRGGEVPVGAATIEGHVADLIREHRPTWRKEVSAPGAERVLADETIGRLEALRLCRRTEVGVFPLPAVARYALVVERAETDAEGHPERQRRLL